MVNFKKTLVSLGDLNYYQKLSSELQDCRSVLDLGCGSWSPLAKVKKHFYAEGVDLHQESLRKIKKTKIHDKYRLADVRKIDQFYKPKSFDAVIALDLVEHLPKKDGLNLIKKMEKIARKKVIFLTPNGFVRQDSRGKNPYQVHQSGWQIEELKKMGYKIYGMRGLKFIRGEYATIKFKPWLFWGIIATISEFLVYFWPKMAYQLLACKDLKKV